MVKVCVIGAGAAGITAAKQAINFGFDVIVYEQTDQVGGTWVYDPELTAHSAMYEVLLTNSPKEVMNYHDQDIQKTLPSFIGHEDMLNYLIDYAKDLPIQLEHRVDSVVREENTWKVTVYHAGKSETIDFDVVMVCNGHYFCPKYTFPYENFNGKVVHSKDYRRAGDFIDERIVVVGSGPSGIDIALQLSTTAREVYLVGRFAEFEGLPNNLTQCLTKITEASDNRVILTDGNRIENVDSVISCTGYEMKFPFLSDDLVQVTHDGMMVSPLWNHVVHVKYPTSLFFVGISLVSVTLPLFEYQARLALSFINGTGIIPSQEELENFEKKRLEDLIKRGMDGKAYHLMKDDQWDYLYDLAKYGQFEHFTNVEPLRGKENRDIHVIDICDDSFLHKDDYKETKNPKLSIIFLNSLTNSQTKSTEPSFASELNVPTAEIKEERHEIIIEPANYDGGLQTTGSWWDSRICGPVRTKYIVQLKRGDCREYEPHHILDNNWKETKTGDCDMQLQGLSFDCDYEILVTDKKTGQAITSRFVTPSCSSLANDAKLDCSALTTPLFCSTRRQTVICHWSRRLDDTTENTEEKSNTIVGYRILLTSSAQSLSNITINPPHLREVRYEKLKPFEVYTVEVQSITNRGFGRTASVNFVASFEHFSNNEIMQFPDGHMIELPLSSYSSYSYFKLYILTIIVVINIINNMS